MAAPQHTFAIMFHLIDAERMRQTGNVEQSTVRVITGLFSGNQGEVLKSPPVRGARQLNASLIRLAHAPEDSRRLARTATQSGTFQFYYCAGCGRKFSRNGCDTCGVRLQSISLLGSFPAVPAKVLDYARRLGVKFAHQHPRG